MSDPEVVASGDVEGTTDSDLVEDDRRRPWSTRLIAILLLLLLTLCVVVTMLDVIISRGPQQAVFVARNLECLQCHAELMPDFALPVVHQPFAMQECTICHTPHGKQVTSTVSARQGTRTTRVRTVLQWLPLRLWLAAREGLMRGTGSASVSTLSSRQYSSQVTTTTPGAASTLTMPEVKLCYTCHGSIGALLGDEYQHQPFETGQCTTCHSPHASEFRGLLAQPPNQLCFTCHPMGAQINRMQAHPPAKAGWCTDCHSPHASNNRGILVARQRDLCFRCHPSVAVLADMPVQHQPFAQDNCTGCHEPHGSDYAPLLDAAQPQLCYSCHPAIENQFAQRSHHPIGVELRCGSCHDPHAAPYQGLVNAQDNGFCYQCHGDAQALYADSKHSPLLCIRCHTPHGSPYAPILVAENPNLCLACHPALEGQNKHPVRQEFFDVHAKKGLTCSSSCHNPHGTKYEFMIRNFNAPQDGQCLQCHKYVGTYF